jgi:aminomethyltransferase
MSLKRTPLYDLHAANGAKFVPFAGYEMPVQYKDMGVMAEHLHTRNKAGLFDVSHMGQVFINGESDPADALEAVIPSDLKNQKIGQMRYTVLLNENGGIIDDLIVTRLSETEFYIVINAARIDQDVPALKNAIGSTFNFKHDTDRALIALQGPSAESALIPFFDSVKNLTFMNAVQLDDILISRSGYTGEDGFEISIPLAKLRPILDGLLGNDDVKLIGLGARDSLRLEAGLCLYGHDLNEDISPIDAGLNWVIQKSRREAANFNGATRILNEIENGTDMKRVGLLPDGRAPIREGVELVNNDGENIGFVTSGTYSPCLEKPIAMAYVKRAYSKTGTEVKALLRGKPIPAKIAKMPFIESNTKKG